VIAALKGKDNASPDCPHITQSVVVIARIVKIRYRQTHSICSDWIRIKKLKVSRASTRILQREG
jgi:hypothetical protein